MRPKCIVAPSGWSKPPGRVTHAERLSGNEQETSGDSEGRGAFPGGPSRTCRGEQRRGVPDRAGAQNRPAPEHRGGTGACPGHVGGPTGQRVDQAGEEAERWRVMTADLSAALHRLGRLVAELTRAADGVEAGRPVTAA